MRYYEYLRRGYLIASGVIERACRHLVKDRSILDVRAAFQSDHWETFLAARIDLSASRLHPNDITAVW